MLVPSVLIGLLPTYGQVGILSTLLLITCRLLQGIAGGGEMVAAIVYVVENNQDNYASYYGSLCKMSGNAGSTLGLGVVALLRYNLADQSMLDWGWRIPFIASFFFGICGVLLRSSLYHEKKDAESEYNFAYSNEKQSTKVSSLVQEIRAALWPIFLTLLVTATWCTSYYSILIWTAYFLADSSLSQTTCITKGQIWVLTFCMNILIVALMPVFGLCNDLINRGHSFLLTAASTLLTILSIPTFALIASNDIYLITSGLLLFSTFIAMFGYDFFLLLRLTRYVIYV